MPRQISAVTATATGSTTADLAFSYTGSYDGGNNNPSCGGGSGAVYTLAEKRDVTAAGAWTTVATLTGGTTGATSTTATGLTAGHLYEFRASSYQERQAFNTTEGVCEPAQTGAAGPITSNQITTFAVIGATLASTLALPTPSAAATVRVVTTAAQSLSVPTCAASVTHPVQGAGVSVSPIPSLASLVTHPIVAAAASPVPHLTNAGFIRTVNMADLSKTVGLVSFSASGTVGVVATLSLVLDVPALEFTGSQPWQRAPSGSTAWSAAAGGSAMWTPQAGGSAVWTS